MRLIDEFNALNNTTIMLIKTLKPIYFPPALVQLKKELSRSMTIVTNSSY